MRDDDDDERHKASKSRRDASGAAVRLSGDREPDVASKRTSAGRASQAKKTRARHDRSLSEIYGNITWRYSALIPLSDYDNVSSDDDEDRDALSAKVPPSKIRGGELIGLSPHPPTLSESTSSGVGPRTIRCTGFGSNRKPIPIFSEPEPETAAAAPTVVAASASAPVASTTTASGLFAATKPSEPSEPSTTTMSLAPTSSSLFSGMSFKPATDAAGKSETEKTAAPAVTLAPLFIFGKPAADAASEKPAADATEKTATDATENTSDVATAPTTPTTPKFSFASVSAADNTPSAKALDDTWRKSTAPAGAFSVKPATSATANTTGATTPELAPKAVTSVPTFSFGLSKPAADSASKPAATAGLFSFGAAAATSNATTTSAVVAGDKPKSEFKFSFGSFGAASTAGTQATSVAADKPAQQTTFDQFDVAATSSETPNILTAKRTRGDEASGSDAPAASKPTFNFGSSGATGSGFSLTSSTSNAPAFGSLTSKNAATPVFGATTASSTSTAAASSKPAGTFT
ncbi:hypothetical protein GGI21_004837, partial [Coemansia aciculifera]